MRVPVRIRNHRGASEAGFTLIELSIVIVIIGLIIGAIAVGSDMIEAAEIRAQITQIQKYDSAVNTFRHRYNYIPGDMPSTVAAQFGFFSVTGANANTQGYGDGDGLIEVFAASDCCEPLIFWRHLTDAGLIDGNFGTAASGNALLPSMFFENTSVFTTAIPPAAAGTLFPPAKLGRGNYILLYSVGGQNYFEITGLAGMEADGPFGNVNPAMPFNITPQEAYTIDSKIDDGLPNSGSVQAMYFKKNIGYGAGTAAVSYLAPDGACTTAENIYNTATSSAANTPACQLAIRFN